MHPRNECRGSCCSEWEGMDVCVMTKVWSANNILSVGSAMAKGSKEWKSLRLFFFGGGDTERAVAVDNTPYGPWRWRLPVPLTLYHWNAKLKDITFIKKTSSEIVRLATSANRHWGVKLCCRDRAKRKYMWIIQFPMRIE